MPADDKSIAPLRGTALLIELAVLGLLALVWGSSYGMIKIAVGTIPPFTVVLIRMVIGAVVLWIVVWWRGDAIPRSPATWGHFLIQGATATVIPYSMGSWGQQYVDSSLASILNSTSPLYVFLFTQFWTRHEAMTPLRLAGVAIGLGGTCLIVGIDALHGLGEHVGGQISIMAAAIFYALSAVFSRHFRSIAPTVTTASTLTVSMFLIVPLAFIFEKPLDMTPSTASLIAVFLLGFVSTALAGLLYYRLIKTLGSMGTSSVSYLRVSVSVAIGILFLGESFTWQTTVGLVAVILGVAAINGHLSFGGARR